jgi:hypothetical protein
MEMVEGATLEARIAHGPLAIDEARQVGIQIADAHAGIGELRVGPELWQLGPKGLVRAA